MGEPAIKYTFTIEEYLEREKTSLVKHEYHEGEIFAMAGSTPRHSRITTNTTRELGNALSGTACLEYNSDLQIATSRQKFVYPDASVVCGELSTYEENPLASNNPVLIVEVLSDSTAAYDRTGKFMRYRQIPTFREYVLIEQGFPFVEVRTKLEDETWQIRIYEGLSETVVLKGIDVQIPMARLYSGVVFDANSAEEWFNRTRS
ncbi:MAG: Uma2 family endonuclease [Cytophagaceae bacterium]|nr:Uma2 family endonuclease [Cytophagaceae bacterium]